MEKLTDRSPRTPPALSNATPRTFMEAAAKLRAMSAYDDDGFACGLDGAADKLEEWAAPPVAEGPAATPRCPTCGAPTLKDGQRHAVVNPPTVAPVFDMSDEEADGIALSGVSQPLCIRCGVTLKEAEDAESTACAHSFDEFAAEPPEARAAARARRERQAAIRILKELREAAVKLLNVPAVVQVLGWNHTENCDCPMCELRALLGPQHGDTK